MKKTIVMETPLGDVTISGSPQAVDEIIRRVSSHDALLKEIDEWVRGEYPATHLNTEQEAQ